ncbi:MAG: hypothetical protein HBSAPP03_07880 [Phycisphaerae bacterium]|nr:MAG: hypothetical protein HBSAPP03_07880 [Phycisphaerae bacterium]
MALASGLAAFWGTSAHAAPPPEPADADPSSLLTKLVRRLTYGVTDEELNLARTLGYDAYLEYHLNYQAISDTAVETQLSALTTLPMTYQAMLGVTGGQVYNESVEAAIVRAALSKRQFFERMVEFWTDHLNVAATDDRLRRLKAIDDRDVIRPHALGNFRALIDASAHSPAMLDYLDNNLSTAGNPNENYARELMELHTMGVDGGYTQQDVIQVARCFTGWQFWNDTQGANSGTFRYNSNQHDTGQKVVLGHVIPARSATAGIQDGLDVLNILLDHPSTARYLAKKLCLWLLGYDVPQGVIDSVAAAYTSSNGDIKSMIRAALKPNYLAAASPKYKRPWHLFINCLRVAPTTITSTSNVRSQLVAAGMPRFLWSTPDGYPDDLDYWVGLIIARWNFAAQLTNPGYAGITVNTAGYFSGLSTADQMADKINASAFGGELTQAERDRIRTFLLPNTPTLTRQREALGLAMSCPTFQWH